MICSASINPAPASLPAEDNAEDNAKDDTMKSRQQVEEEDEVLEVSKNFRRSRTQVAGQRPQVNGRRSKVH
ncbi:hypothetical protein ON010_g18225 [Phytophthora cinnamomi]|nr:hypothetical protein ON010_g18225 [Phytophthora cinnamomi]